ARSPVAESIVRLVACPACHAQYDVTTYETSGTSSVRCHCGESVPIVEARAVDAHIQRCSSCGAGLENGAAQCGFCGSVVERDARRLSLICPECFARNADRARFCAACGVAFKPQAVPDETVAHGCPCCERVMTRRSIGGVRVEECTRCHGLWVPGESFERLIERAVTAQREAAASAMLTGLGNARRVRRKRRSEFSATVSYRRCPVCEARMHRKNFGRRSGVIVDWCRGHGTWLDADELEDIAAFILRGGLAASRAPGAGAGGHGAGQGLFAAALGGGKPLSGEQVEALLRVERQFEEARDESARRARRIRHRLGHRHGGGGGGWRRTLGDLLEGLLGD
ncbi:MAG: zf-TFIIB domain-containing protein, partial [Candidatus Eiseniibacteriota bacterium]